MRKPLIATTTTTTARTTTEPKAMNVTQRDELQWIVNKNTNTFIV